jgi:hypothetical protein
MHVEWILRRTYNGHLLVDVSNSGVLDSVPEHAHENIKAIKCERWEYPWRSIYRMIAYCDKEGHECEDAIIVVAN